MKKGLVVLIVLFIGLMAASSPENTAPGKDTQLRKQDRSPVNVNVNGSGYVKPGLYFGKFPLYFIYNKGQVHKKAKFYARASRYTLWLTKEGLVFDSVNRDRIDFKYEIEKKYRHSPHSPLFAQSSKVTRDVSRLNFIGANKNPEIVPVEEAKLRVNYFIGNDRSKWQCNVPTSQAVLYKELYTNIDLKVYGIEKQIEYDWIVKPGGNPADIIFAYKNVKGTRIDEEGNLLIETGIGELMHKRPVGYQEKLGRKVEVKAEFKKIEDNTYGFEVGKYDKSCDLIIDPVVLAYSSYLGGGNNGSNALDIAVDDKGCVYVCGFTFSYGFPTLNQFQSDQKTVDAFVSKIDTTQSGASSLIYSTYLGGSGGDYSRGIAVDYTGNVYVTGQTYSTDFPVLNQYQGYQGKPDAFVVKLDTTQSGVSSLVYSTYLGSSKADNGSEIAIDTKGIVYLTGETYGNDFPTLNHFQGVLLKIDAFVAKLDTTRPGVSGLIYSTFLGGGDTDRGRAIAVDSSGYVYVVGDTYSSDFPIKNHYQTYQSWRDIFVTKLDTTISGSSSLVYSTFLGGDGGENGSGIAVDNNGNVFVSGDTSSLNFPILNQYQTSENGANNMFVTKLNTKKRGISSLVYSTYLGGGYSHGITVDNRGYTYLTGTTISPNFPILHEYQSTNLLYDAFVTKLDTNQSGSASLVYSTYLGGSDNESSNGISVDKNGNVYIAGRTFSTDFPIQNQYQTNPSNNFDAFITKLVFKIPPAVATKVVSSITSISATCGGNVAYDGGTAVTARGVCWSTSLNPRTYDNFTIDGTGTGKFTSSLTGLTANTTYYVRAYATNSIGTAYGNERSFTTADYSSTPGSIIITNPRDGGSVSGPVIIKAEVTSNRSNSANTSAQQVVTHVEFYIDAKLEKQDTRAPYEHRWDTNVIPNGNHTIRAKVFYANGQTGQDEITVNVINSPAPPYIQLNRARLNFGVVIGESQTGAQTFLIENSGGCCLDWTASTSDSWIKATPLSGTANMLVTVTLDVSGLSAAKYQGSVTINSANADNSPVVVDIYLDVKEKAQGEPPFGSFDSPLDGADVYSTVPFTGWALDDIEVASVKIFRNPVEGHETGLIYIGDAVLVEGVRPDVETGYPGFPKSFQAGWGYQMLTNFLPNGGNGTYVIHAIATDSSGNEVTFGSKTINCDNEHAVKPFGTIDIPTQGGVASGQDFVNFGWALTPRPNMIPKDGSTIDVWIDGVLLDGHPVYNQYRKDIADGFPNYANSNGAVGYYYLDTTLYANGVHTISWSVTDNAGNTDGLGSRYFNILNIQNKAAARTHYKPVRMDFDVQKLDLSPAPVYLKKGYSNESIPRTVSPDKEGITNIVIKENERIELRVSSPFLAISGYMMAGDTLKPLPTGSTWDASAGIFYWQPGPGHLGEYRFVFIEKGPYGKICKKRIRVLIIPKH
jgi:hypothetical protein